MSNEITKILKEDYLIKRYIIASLARPTISFKNGFKAVIDRRDGSVRYTNKRGSKCRFLVLSNEVREEFLNHNNEWRRTSSFKREDYLRMAKEWEETKDEKCHTRFIY